MGLLCKLVYNLIKLIYQTHINAITSLSRVNENPNVKSSYGNIRLIEIRRIFTDKYTSLLERVEPNELENHIHFP